MIALIQRVHKASVEVDAQCIAQCEQGLLVLVGVRQGDTAAQAERLAERICGYRIFADDAGRMNRSLRDIGGGLILVPQFTLAADTRAGMRPSFTTAAAPDLARPLFEQLLIATRRLLPAVQAGQFGADMKVALVNDGPVTFWLEA